MSFLRATKQKITVGYSLLLAMLLFALLFVYHEMETLATVDDRQNLKTDSLLMFLHEKDQNAIRMLSVLNEANDNLLSESEVEYLIAGQDSLLTKQHIQNRVLTKRDSLMTKPKKKGFFKRLAEAFVPSKEDTAVWINTSQEFAADTLIEPIYSRDSLQQKIRKVSQKKRSQHEKTIRRNNATYQQLNEQLTNRMDSLIKNNEATMLLRAHNDATLQQSVRMRSTRIIGGIAVGAVLLSALFLILIRRDITQSNRYRMQLEEANKRAEDLLTAREKLMLTITHDFKSPLGSIMGYTELLSQLTEDEQQSLYLENMKGSSEHLLKLVNDLLDFHRLDLNKAEVNRVSFVPSRLLEEIGIRFHPQTTAKGLTMECRIAPALSGRYISDPLRIQQIVNNLLSNAVKFTQHGTVSLTASYEDSRLVIKVADTGKGMVLEDKERIFHEFTRLPGAQGEEGFGLGLSIVQKLISLLEGDIQVESTLGEGSCFTITLPIYPVGSVFVVEEQPESVSNKSPLRVLLIDDDKIQLALTAAMLKQQGIDSACCNQLEELTEQLRSSEFDLLLTDIQMPTLNGFDLVKLLRASNLSQARTIPIVAVTARSEMDQQMANEHGFAGCLHKPFTVRELLSVCHTLSTNSLSPLFKFSELTAFSEGDLEASVAIIRTFIEETGKNGHSMQQALNNQDTNEIAALAHKLLPLFTLINVSEALSSLSWLESQREKDFSDEIRQLTVQLLTSIDKVTKAAEEHLLSLK